MRNEPPYGLLNRIMATGDPGVVLAQGPANAQSARRARLTGPERLTADGGGSLELRAKLHLKWLEEMLKNQSGVHVRQPSHHAPPFRAFAFVSQANAVELDSGADPSTDVTATLLDVDFGSGVTVVPSRHRGVISRVSVVGTIDPGSTAIDPATVITFNLQRNGVPVQGYVQRPVDSAVGFVNDAFGTGTTGSALVFQGPTPAPVHLKGGDSVSIQGVLDAVAAGALFLGRVSTRVEGWLYPERIGQDSIAGTLVD